LRTIGLIHMTDGDHEEAKKWLNRVIQKFPTDSISMVHLGAIYFSLSEHKMAIATLKKSATFITHNYTPYYLLALTYSNLNKKSSALFYLKKAISLNNFAKSKARQDAPFKWLSSDIDFVKMTSLANDETISEDDAYFEINIFE
jgi:tetratricopeptide (TPR) repeat protein